MTESSQDLRKIIESAVEAVKPERLIKDALEDFCLPCGRLIMLSIGKAAYSMGKAALEVLGDKIDTGIIITKHGFVPKPIENVSKLGKVKVLTAGHPLTDEESIKATRKALDMVSNLTDDDKVLLLLSGGASALFEEPLIELDEYNEIVDRLLKSGASIDELNTVRKRLSSVKGGRLAEIISPAKVDAYILSDVLYNRLDIIASGPVTIDTSKYEDAVAVLDKYAISLSENAKEILKRPLPKEITNVTTSILACVYDMCNAAKRAAGSLGYNATCVKYDVTGEAVNVGKKLAVKSREVLPDIVAGNEEYKGVVYIYGGETTVKVKGTGIGGRNLETALSAAIDIKGEDNVLIASIASDGDDGTSGVAGAIVDGKTIEKISLNSALEALKNNDSYTALKKADTIVDLGVTGTNVNDLMIVLRRTRA